MHEGKRVATRVAALVLFAGLAVGAAGCGDDDDDNPTSPSPAIVDVSGVIANNHGHVAVVTAAQIQAGAAVVFSIRGTADHDHTLEVRNDDMVRLRTRQRVERDSSLNNGHTHRVTFN